MRVIFLDFDGVIRIPDGSGGPASYHFQEKPIQLVADFTKETGAKIVVSSTWRQMASFDRILLEMGDSVKKSMFHEFWMTPILSAKQRKLIPRGAEISTWLFNHDCKAEFVIFDDLGPDEFPVMQHRFVQCDSNVGVTEREISKAREILEK